MAGLKIERMTILMKSRSERSFREIGKLSILVAVVAQSALVFAQNSSPPSPIEVWKAGRRSEVQVQNLNGNYNDSDHGKARAQRALIEAQTQIQLGNFANAIQLTRFADSFPVSWGPMEISPRQILGQLRASRKQSSTDGKTRRKVKPFLWDATNFSNRTEITTQRTIPTQPVSNSSNNTEQNRFPPFPTVNDNNPIENSSNKPLPRSWEDSDNKSSDPWPHSETAHAKKRKPTSGIDNPFIVENKTDSSKGNGPVFIQPPVKIDNRDSSATAAPRTVVENNKTDESTTQKTGRELFPVPPAPKPTIQQPPVATTTNHNPSSEKEPSTLLVNSTMNLISTMIGVITGAIGVIFLLKLFGKQLGPLVKVEVVGDGSAFFQKQSATDSVPPLRTQRSEEELQKHFEIPSLGSSYAEKRKADEEKRQQQEKEIFKLIMEQNIELRDRLAGHENHAA